MTDNKTIFNFNNNLSKLIINSCIKCKDKISININNPILMSDIKKINNIYNNNIRITKYDNVTVFLDNNKYPTIFGSNIDTILFCYAIKKYKKLFDKINNFFELGTGGGFISKYLATKFKIKTAYLNDINKESIKYISNELELPKLKNEPKKIYYNKNPFYKTIKKNGYVIIEGDGINILNLFYKKHQKFDLLVCNPPYIPKNNKEEDLDINSPNFFEGTRLLRYLLLNFNNFTDKMVIIISSTSFLNNRVINNLKQVKFKILLKHQVPLKVYNNKKNIEENKTYYNFLTSKKEEEILINNNKFIIGAIINPNSLYSLEHIIYILYIYK